MSSNSFDMPDKWTMRHFIQSIPIFFFYILFRTLPIDWASAMGGWIGRHVGPRLGVTKKARRNLQLALPERADEHATIIRNMWDNMGRVMAEASHLKTLVRKKRVDIVGMKHIETLQNTNTPAFLIGGHFANWEIGPVVMHYEGVPLSVAYRPPNNLFVDWLLKKSRQDMKMSLLPKGRNSLRQMIKIIRDKGYVGWLVDQKENMGIECTFFNAPAMTSPAVVDLALKSEAKILPTTVTRLKGSHFRVVIHPPMDIAITDDRAHDVTVGTQKMNNFLENHIRAYPGQWLWLHQRWPQSAYDALETK